MTEPLANAGTAQLAPEIVPIVARDGARSELLWVQPQVAAHTTLYWLPALGVPAKHYLPLAFCLAKLGVAVALHEWRGIGSSDRRAGRHVDWSYRQLLQDDLPAGLAVLHERMPKMRHLIGGHSLGGQLACLYAGQHPQTLDGIALVASGAPYWRAFKQARLSYLAYVLMPWMADLIGYMPGRRLGFGGNEARGLIRDWARSGRTGRYSATGMPGSLDASLAELRLPLLGIRQHDDWMVPAASLDWLLGKMPLAAKQTLILGSEEQAGISADHFGWMKAPALVAQHIAAWASAQTGSESGVIGVRGEEGRCAP